MSIVQIEIKTKDNAPERLSQSHIALGFVVSNKANEQNPNYFLPQHLNEVFKYAEKQRLGLEIQFEFDADATPNWPTTSPPKLPFLGVHLPIVNVNFGNSDPAETSRSLNTNAQAITLAEKLKADYLVAHLQTPPIWDNLEERPALVASAKKNFVEVVEKAYELGFSGIFALENLEFPLYPATNQEILEASDWVKKVSLQYNIPAGVAFDISHLWHTGILVAENAWRGNVMNPFMDSLALGKESLAEHITFLLNKLGDDLKVVHVTGGQIRADAHETHLPPLVSDNGSINERRQLPVNAALSAIKTFALKRQFQLPVVNESHNYPYQEMAQACHKIQTYLNI